MMGMASPTGYLDLVQPAVTSATEVGTATVDGVAVTQYQLTIDPGSLATAPGTSSEEQSAINAAIQTLTSQGYQTHPRPRLHRRVGVHPRVGVDGDLRDGGTVTLDAHFSNFGCAGTVLMPGQGGVSTPPSGCVSADTGTVPTTSTPRPQRARTRKPRRPSRRRRRSRPPRRQRPRRHRRIHDDDYDIIDVDNDSVHDDDQLTRTSHPLRRSSRRHG